MILKNGERDFGVAGGMRATMKDGTVGIIGEFVTLTGFYLELDDGNVVRAVTNDIDFVETWN